jgi:hypothetical protein
MTASDSKTAEFARLFDLFERLASRKSRAINGESHTTTLNSMPVPPDLALVVNSLASLVDTRKQRGDTRSKKSGGRARRNTVASPGMTIHDIDSDDEDDASLAKFPLGKKYPFTFKMMLYKLYQLDDWAEKVKQVLERSQIEYKPLAKIGSEEEGQEVMDEEGMEVEDKPSGRVHFKAGVVSGGARRPYVRPRSHSVLVLGKGRDVGAGPTSPGRMSKQVVLEETRAVKKRCVGRRKSMGGPPTVEAEVGRVGGGWVYDAAVSSFESTARRDMGAFVAPGLQPRSRYQSLGGMRKVAATRGIRVGSPNTPGVPWEKPQEGRVMARRRALSAMENLKPDVMQQRLMKRPFGL